jgi:hypothetical protein
MGKAGRGTGVAQELRAQKLPLGDIGYLEVDRLDGDLAAQQRVVSQVHHAHAAASQLFLNFVSANLLDHRIT